MSPLKVSKHASLRQAGRAISDRAVEMVMEFGRCFWAGRGCLAYFVGRRDVREDSTLAEVKNIAVIVSANGTLVTVEHCARPPKHWKPARSSGRWRVVHA